MKQTSYVWYCAKPGEERRYAMPREPSPEFAAVLKGEGYRIFRVEFELPDWWDAADAWIKSGQRREPVYVNTIAFGIAGLCFGVIAWPGAGHGFPWTIPVGLAFGAAFGTVVSYVRRWLTRAK